MEKFLVDPEDGRAVVAIHEATSLREAARMLNCDPAGLHRRVRRLAEQNLLHKVQGQWALTERGRALMAWTRDSMISQRRFLNKKQIVRICSTSWLSERALIPRLSGLVKLAGSHCSGVELSIPAKSFERTLLEGTADFVLTCQPPEDPAIAHRQICPEVWCAVVSPRLVKSRARAKLQDLRSLSYVHHRKLNPGVFAFRGEEEELSFDRTSLITTDNLIGIRAAVLAGLGWSFVPLALVADEIRAGTLLSLELELDLDRKICLWWLRDSAPARALAPLLAQWAKTCF